MGLTNLPQELIDNIVDQVDNKDLFSCSLVSRIFLSRCRQHLFHTLNIVVTKMGYISFAFSENRPGRREVVKFLALLHRHPTNVRSYIRHLRVDMALDALFYYGRPLYQYEELVEVLQLVSPRVQDFTLKLANQALDATEQTVQKNHDLFCRHSILQNVTTLDLKRISTLPFNLAGCSNLVALTVHKCTFEVGSGLAVSFRQRAPVVLNNLTRFSVSLEDVNTERGLHLAEGVLQLSAYSIQHLIFMYPAGPAYFRSPNLNILIQKITEGVRSSKILSLENFPSLQRLDFEIIDVLFYREERGFLPIAELLKTCTSDSKLSSISVSTTLRIAHSRLTKSTDDLYEDWEWRNWGILDEPLDNIGKTLQRPITLEVHAHIEARRDRRLRFPKPELGRKPDFKSLFRDKFPKACRSEFLSWNYDWTVYEC